MRKNIEIDEELYRAISAYAKLKGFKKVGHAVNLAIEIFLKNEDIGIFSNKNKEK